MADEREWVPVEVLWDEGLRRPERFADRSWDEEFDEVELERWLMEADDQALGANLTRRKRKRARGDGRQRGV